MTRSVAMRASALFILFAALFAATGFSAGVPLAEALFLVSLSLAAVMMGFAASTPVRAAIPVRVRTRR